MQTKSVQKFITFSPELYQLAISKAQLYGFSVAEYVRHLIANDVKREATEISMVDAQTEQQIGHALEDYKAGKYTTLKTDEEIDTYFDKLDDQLL